MSKAIRDYDKLAVDIIEAVGGEKNIVKASRCATRLRLVLKDTPNDANKRVSALTGVINSSWKWRSISGCYRNSCG